MSSLESDQLLHIFGLPLTTKWKQRTQGKYMVNDKATESFCHSVTSTIFPLHKERHLSGHNQIYTKSYHLMLTK